MRYGVGCRKFLGVTHLQILVTDGFTPDRKYEICPQKASNAMERLQNGLASPFEGHLNQAIREHVESKGWQYNNSYSINKTTRSRWRSCDGKSTRYLYGAVILAIDDLLGGFDVSKLGITRFFHAPNAHIPFIKYNNFAPLMYMAGQFTFTSNQPFESGQADEALVEIDLGFKTLRKSHGSENEMLFVRVEIGILEAELHICCPTTEMSPKYEIFSDPHEKTRSVGLQRNFTVRLWEKADKIWIIRSENPADCLNGTFQKTFCKIVGDFNAGDRVSLMFRPTSIHAQVLEINSPSISASLANASKEKRALLRLLIEEEVIDSLELVDGCGFELRDTNEA